MDRCLTPQEIEGYSRGTLGMPDRWEMAAAHLATCAACRDAAAAATTVAAGTLAHALVPAAVEASCLDDVLVQRYVYGEADATDAAIVESHVANCPLCAGDIASLRRFKAEMAGYDWSEARAAAVEPSAGGRLWAALWGSPARRPALQLAGAAALVVVAALVVHQMSTAPLNTQVLALNAQLDEMERQNADLRRQAAAVQGLETEVQRLQREARSNGEEAARMRMEIARLRQGEPGGPAARPQPALVLRDAAGPIGVGADGALQWKGAAVDPRLRRAAQTALITHRLPKPEIVAALFGESTRLRGSTGNGMPFAIIGPVATAVRSGAPTFRWRPLAGATHYVVTVYDSGFHLVARSPDLRATNWTPAAPLRRGESYAWQVKAFREGEEVLSPEPPAPEAMFRVLDAATARALDRARHEIGGSHLLLGILCASEGLLDDAERELEALRSLNPGSPVALQLLESVRGLRTTPGRSGG